MGQTYRTRNNYHIVDSLRLRGWMVAVHNDYKLRGRLYTFWLFTKGDICVKGEGFTDTIALSIVVQKIFDLEEKSKPGDRMGGPRPVRSARRTGTKPERSSGQLRTRRTRTRSE